MQTPKNIKKEKVLMKHNGITKAKFNLTTVENRVFQLVMYKLQKSGKGVLECDITLNEFKEIIKRKGEATPKEISKMLVALRKQSIYFKKTELEMQEDMKIGKEAGIWGEWGIINGHQYDESTKTFKIEASERLHSMLHDYMGEGYTPVNLNVFFSLSNSNSQRLYDLLRLWSNTKRVVNYTLTELKQLLMIENKYPRYVDFKRRILTPAINELNSTGMFNIELKENRRNRAVVSVDFIVEDLDKRKYFESNVIPEGNDEGEDESEGSKDNEIHPEDNNEDLSEESTGAEESAVDVEEDEAEDNSYLPPSLQRILAGRKESEEVQEEPKKEAKAEVLSEAKIPEETMVIKPLHRLIKARFKGIDFTEGEYYMAYLEAEVSAQIQDNVEVIGKEQWDYFRTTLENKVNRIKAEQQATARGQYFEDVLARY